MREEPQVFVVDPHAIFRRGVVECLRALPGAAFTEAATVAEVEDDPALPTAAALLIDPALPGSGGLIRSVAARGVPVIACVDREEDVAAARASGACGFLHKDSLTPEMLAAGVRAVATGLTVVAPPLLGALTAPSFAERSVPAHGPAPAPRPALSPREQRVLTLLADGLATREVAERLSYSERTVKNVLHDAVTKLGARSRSEAIAQAVRAGLI